MNDRILALWRGRYWQTTLACQPRTTAHTTPIKRRGKTHDLSKPLTADGRPMSRVFRDGEWQDAK